MKAFGFFTVSAKNRKRHQFFTDWYLVIVFAPSKVADRRQNLKVPLALALNPEPAGIALNVSN